MVRSLLHPFLCSERVCGFTIKLSFIRSHYMGRRFFALFVAILTFWTAFAEQDVTFQANAPMIVGVGEPFRVEFELNAKPDDKSFSPPSFEGFNVVAGPSVSRGSSMQIINAINAQAKPAGALLRSIPVALLQWLRLVSWLVMII